MSFLANVRFEQKVTFINKLQTCMHVTSEKLGEDKASIDFSTAKNISIGQQIRKSSKTFLCDSIFVKVLPKLQAQENNFTSYKTIFSRTFFKVI